MKKFFLLITLLFIISCASASTEMGKRYDTNAAEQIMIGKTTEPEVIALLGEPVRKKIEQDGTVKYGYIHIESKANAVLFSAKGKATGDKLIITFDKNGIVRSIDRATLP